MQLHQMLKLIMSLSHNAVDDLKVNIQGHHCHWQQLLPVCSADCEKVTSHWSVGYRDTVDVTSAFQRSICIIYIFY